jgi:VanZ family protein
MPQRIARFIYRYHIASIIGGLGIITICLIKLPDNESGITWPYFDKLVHYIMYLCLCGAYLFESSHKSTSGRFWNYAKGLFYCAVMAGAIEIAQETLTDYRSADWWDFWAGMAGALTSCGVAVLVRLSFRSRGR